MSTYVRPPIEIATYRDADGAPVLYGDRWGDTPPDDQYSQCGHPERFEPIEIVARALIDHLEHTYDVDRSDDTVGTRTTTTLRPRNDGAVLVLTLSLPGLPGVDLRAGSRFGESWPDCGCDACDDDVRFMIDELEQHVLAVVGGGLSEWRSGPDPSQPIYTDDAGRAVGGEHMSWGLHYALVRPDGESTDGGSWSSDESEPVELPMEPHRWAAWPVRSSA